MPEPRKSQKKLTIACKILLCASILYNASGAGLPLAGGFGGLSTAEAAGGPAALAALGAPADTPAPEALRRFAAEAIGQLAQAKPFTAWAGAATAIEPLGPGTHSWLVTVAAAAGSGQGGETGVPPGASAPRGYLIISATESGDYKLVEYGMGTYSVFDPALLEAALRQSGLGAAAAGRVTAVPLYAGPALAAWKIRLPDGGEPRYVNAADGEWLPETTGSWDKQAGGYAPPRLASSSRAPLSPAPIVYTSSRFDPYDNLLWMTAKPLALKSDAFIGKLKASRQLVYAASGAERTYSFPLPVYGYQTWTNGDPSATPIAGSEAVYVVTGTDTAIRLIALDALMASGKFVTF
ncbi:hypothetical protein M0651_22290 [Paenibacillus sp. MBLB2552]|uniref:Uncharacterized protein n=1 Tax=Paenibacillus mellifer TaxID=2937794 RepID=A0A9X2BTX1_9BACL|nr:hypothetical protein [Paenibacillus mellifer]MCK8489905.1 hypothetical protein [Paenibacillus mellifer]